MRDSQRSKAQQATTAARRDDAVTFATFDAAQAYLDVRVRTAWFRRRYPEIAEKGVFVKPLAVGARSEWAWETIALERTKYKTAMFPIVHLPTWTGALFDASDFAYSDLLLWHLVAHHAAETSTHDRCWARVFLELVRHFVGQAAARGLRESFSRHHVHYRRMLLTDEQRAARRERFYERGLVRRGAA